MLNLAWFENAFTASAIKVCLQDKLYGTAEAHLDTLDDLMKGNCASGCLSAALDAPDGLFAKLLDHCVPGEYAAEFEIKEAGLSEKPLVFFGTILAAAAAMNQTEKMALLLERGYDCNGSSIDAANGVLTSCEEYMFCDDLSAEMKELEDEDGWYSFDGYFPKMTGQKKTGCYCTPLAAAILSGSREAVSFLLRNPDLRVWEDRSVCAAAALVWNGSAAQQACVRLAFLGAADQPLSEIYTRRPLRAEQFIQLCPPEVLRMQIENGMCTEAEMRKAVWGMAEPCAEDGERLLVIKEYFPSVFRESWAQNILVNFCMDAMIEGKPYEPALTQWLKLAGSSPMVVKNKCFARSITALLEHLPKTVRPRIDVNAVPGYLDRRTLRMILRRCDFVRGRAGSGTISGLASAILRKNDIKLLQMAAKRGLLVQEPRKQMLTWLKDNKSGAAQRALVLSFPSVEQAEPDENTLVQQLFVPERTREECQDILYRLGAAEPETLWSLTECQTPGGGVLEPQKLPVFAASCCREKSNVLPVFLEMLPHLAERFSTIGFASDESMTATPMCLAAATGQIAQLRCLLEHGFSAGVENMQDYSVWQSRSGLRFAVTPLLAALLFGQEEAAKLLLEAGARCDCSSRGVRSVLQQADRRCLELLRRLTGQTIDTEMEQI